MRIRNVKNKEEILNNCSFLINTPEEFRGSFNEVFQNDHPIHIEIGMGKGKFIYEMALNNPGINYIGIEKYDSIIAKAISKQEELPNLRLIRMDARDIDSVFDHEIDLIYLNFVDPWPKKRHAKRRLTHEYFLKKYDNIFKGIKQIKLKTDNDLLFESSLESLETYGYKIKNKILDLANSSMENVKTEYEEKWMKQGIKIKYLEALKK